MVAFGSPPIRSALIIVSIYPFQLGKMEFAGSVKVRGKAVSPSHICPSAGDSIFKM
jgi:hypothetical protein